MLVNIYLTEKDKFKLNCISNKYKLSTSTLAENVLIYFTNQILQNLDGKDILYKIGKEYIYENKGKKTSIKPQKDPVNTNTIYFENLTKAYTNVLTIWLRKDITKYLSKEQAKVFYNKLNSGLQNIREPNWDYNRFIRSMKRYEKKRKQTNA